MQVIDPSLTLPRLAIAAAGELSRYLAGEKLEGAHATALGQRFLDAAKQGSAETVTNLDDRRLLTALRASAAGAENATAVELRHFSARMGEKLVQVWNKPAEKREEMQGLAQFCQSLALKTTPAPYREKPLTAFRRGWNIG